MSSKEFFLENYAKKNKMKGCRTLEETLHLFNENPSILLRSIHKYSTEELMMKLDQERLAALEDEFRTKSEGIDLPKFIWLMQCAITHPPTDKYELVKGLIALFNDIDINGDGNIEWSEFTQYIIDAVITQDEVNHEQKDNLNKDQQNKQDKKLIDRAYAKGSIDYVANKNLKDKTSYKDSIQKIQMHDNLECYIILEHQQKRLKFLNKDFTGKLNLELPSLYLNQGNIFILDFAVNPIENILCCLTSDRKMMFWDLDNSKLDKMLYVAEIDCLQEHVWWISSVNRWVTTTMTFYISTWVFRRNAEKKIREESSFQGHTDKITAMVD